MKDLMNITTVQTMSSREIAETTGKEHRSVLRDIDNLNESYEIMGLHRIVQSSYSNEQGRQFRQFELTRIQTFDLMTGYNVELRIKVNRRWEELENAQKPQLPQTYADALRQLAEQVESNDRQQRLLSEQKPKVIFADAVTTSTQSCLVGELAKILRQNGIEIGQNRLFDWLREKNYLCKYGERKNQPTQRAMELELFEVKKTSITKPDGVILITTTTKVTGKGQLYFVNKFLQS